MLILVVSGILLLIIVVSDALMNLKMRVQPSKKFTCDGFFQNYDGSIFKRYDTNDTQPATRLDCRDYFGFPRFIQCSFKKHQSILQINLVGTSNCKKGKQEKKKKKTRTKED